jgi:hypothetical protein
MSVYLPNSAVVPLLPPLDGSSNFWFLIINGALGWEEHVASVEERRDAVRVLVGKSEGRTT